MNSMHLKILDGFLQFTLFAMSCAIAWRWADDSPISIPVQLGVIGINILLILTVKRWKRSKASLIEINAKEFVRDAFPAVVIARGLSSLMIGLLFAFCTFKTVRNIEFLVAEPMSKLPGWEEIGERAYANTTTKSQVSLMTCNVRYTKRFAPEVLSDAKREMQKQILSRVYGAESIQVAHWMLNQAGAFGGINDFEKSKKYCLDALAMSKRLKNDYGQLEALCDLCFVHWAQNDIAGMKDVAAQARQIAENGTTTDAEYEYPHWSRNLMVIDYYFSRLSEKTGHKKLQGIEPKLIAQDNLCNDFEFIALFLGTCVLLTFAGNFADRILLSRLSHRWLKEIGSNTNGIFASERYNRLAIAEQFLGNINKAEFYSMQQIAVLESDGGLAPPNLVTNTD